MKSLSHLPLARHNSLETACTVCFEKGATLIGLEPATELLSKLIFTGTTGIG
jgi:hypothetical protein